MGNMCNEGERRIALSNYGNIVDLGLVSVGSKNNRWCYEKQQSETFE